MGQKRAHVECRKDDNVDDIFGTLYLTILGCGLQYVNVIMILELVKMQDGGKDVVEERSH